LEARQVNSRLRHQGGQPGDEIQQTRLQHCRGACERRRHRPVGATNPAFESLLGLQSGFLDGLSVDEIKAALPSVLSGLGLTASDVISILLLHVGLPDDVDESTASAEALLASGEISVAGSADPLPVSLGNKGVRINYEASVIKADVFADNGVIHYMDTVLVDDLLAP
jgi:hypothetical protein